MKRLLIASALSIVLLTSFTVAQESTLTEGEIDQAVAEGPRERGKLQGLELVDVSNRWASAMSQSIEAVSPSSGPATGVSGYSVLLYSPFTWIKQQASNASKEYRTFTRVDVTAEMLTPVMRVKAYPSAPINFRSASMNRSSSVQHVVLRDARRRTAVQPTAKEAFYAGAQ